MAVVSGQVPGIESQSDMLDYLRQLGLRVNPNIATVKGIGKIKEYIESWRDRRKQLSYETDGIVIKVNDFNFQRSWARHQETRDGLLHINIPRNRASQKSSISQ